MFIDTHTHIYTSEFDADRTEVVARAVKAGAAALLLPNIDEASIRPMLDLCAAHPGLCRPMMGLHPTELPPDPWPLLQRMEKAGLVVRQKGKEDTRQRIVTLTEKGMAMREQMACVPECLGADVVSKVGSADEVLAMIPALDKLIGGLKNIDE